MDSSGASNYEEKLALAFGKLLNAESESDIDMSRTHFASASCCCPPTGHGGEYNSAPRPSLELGPRFSSPRCRSAPNGRESGVKLTLSTAPYNGEESVVVG